MKTMRGVAVIDKGIVRVVDDIPFPEFGDYECLVKIYACGFCTGTDTRIIEGTLDNGFNGYPTILGHEGAGEVVAIGKNVRHISVGERWVHPNMRPNVGNGYTKMYGNMAQYGVINDDRAMLEDGYPTSSLPFPKQHRFPESIPYVDASVIISMAECSSAVKNFGVKEGMNVLIYGAGPMGIGVSMFCKLNGAKTVTQIDHHDDRLERAKRVAGVDCTINSRVADVDEALAGKRFDVVVDAVGLTSIILEGAERLKPGGRVGSFGVIKNHDKLLDITALPRNTCLHMLNDPYGEYEAMDEVIDLIVNGKVNLKDFYSHVLPMEEIGDAVELVKSRKTLKTILTIQHD